MIALNSHAWAELVPQMKPLYESHSAMSGHGYLVSPTFTGTALFIWVCISQEPIVWRMNDKVIKGHFLSLSRTTCRAFLWWEAVSYVLLDLPCHLLTMHSALALNVSVEVILMARVYVVYNRNKNFIYGLGIFRSLTFAGTIVIMVFYIPVGIGLSPGTGCAASISPPFFGFSFVATILNEIILLLCMLFKAWTIYKNEYGSPLLVLLIRDSVLFFFSTFAAQLTNSLVFFVAPRPLVQIGVGWEYAIPCTMGCRVLLNMFAQGSDRGEEILARRQIKPSYMLSDTRIQASSSTDVDLPVVTVSAAKAIDK
ncbi:hypothetical protein JB92DRAFT_3102963 [Gautieria morchelliformis]|nr:hypothetical protein JB92DRAFT_3102963 [Gautieria morchelliformis]